MRFTKMEGCGNDYIYLDWLDGGRLPDTATREALARAVSDRHFGVGGDGLVYIEPGNAHSDCRMRIFNADGSEARMCGNALRCVALYMLERRAFPGDVVRVDTLSGVKTVTALRNGEGKPVAFRADMGVPRFKAEAIPVRAQNTASVPVEACGVVYNLFTLSMGNPHAVAIVDDPATLDLAAIGPLLENAPVFPDRVNVEFIRVREGGLDLRVWERGSGETMACGTGASAAAVAAIHMGLLPCGPIPVRLRGGELTIAWGEKETSVTMTGPARIVFDGDWPEEAAPLRP